MKQRRPAEGGVNVSKARCNLLIQLQQFEMRLWRLYSRERPIVLCRKFLGSILGNPLNFSAANTQHILLQTRPCTLFSREIQSRAAVWVPLTRAPENFHLRSLLFPKSAFNGWTDSESLQYTLPQLGASTACDNSRYCTWYGVSHEINTSIPRNNEE